MEALIELLNRVGKAAEGLGENRYAVYIVTVLGLAALFVLRIIGKRFAEDVYAGLKRAVLRLVGLDRSEGNGPTNGSSPSPGPQTQTEGDGVLRTQRHAYRIQGTLAQGNLAMLHSATNESNHPVVLKIAAQADDNDLLRTESRILMVLGADAGRYGKHLPELLDQFHTSDGRQGNVLGKLDGFDLVTVRERYPQGVPERHIIWILRRTLSVLGYAHSKGVIHGNIEPSHIMLRPADHNVWLIDWCYAIFEPARTGQGFRVANETYSAPEVAQRKPPLPSADLYSVGLTMIYLIGGNPQTKAIPPHVDERLRRFLEFFVLDSPLGRAQDAWELYNRLDDLRKQVYGEHEFVPFAM